MAGIQDNPGLLALLGGIIGVLCKTLADIVTNRRRAMSPPRESLSEILHVFLEQQKSFRDQELKFIGGEFKMNRELFELKWVGVANSILDVKNDLLKLHGRYHELSGPLQALVVKVDLIIKGQIRPDFNEN